MWAQQEDVQIRNRVVFYAQRDIDVRDPGNLVLQHDLRNRDRVVCDRHCSCVGLSNGLGKVVRPIDVCSIDPHNTWNYSRTFGYFGWQNINGNVLNICHRHKIRAGDIFRRVRNDCDLLVAITFVVVDDIDIKCDGLLSSRDNNSDWNG